jgi:hypothetical protein
MVLESRNSLRTFSVEVERDNNGFSDDSPGTSDHLSLLVRIVHDSWGMTIPHNKSWGTRIANP